MNELGSLQRPFVETDCQGGAQQVKQTGSLTPRPGDVETMRLLCSVPSKGAGEVQVRGKDGRLAAPRSPASVVGGSAFSGDPTRWRTWVPNAGGGLVGPILGRRQFLSEFRPLSPNPLQSLDNMPLGARVCAPHADAIEEFSDLNFEAAEYLDAQDKPRPMYRMTRQGGSWRPDGETSMDDTRLQPGYDERE
jgi:hypothetical protein